MTLMVIFVMLIVMIVMFNNGVDFGVGSVCDVCDWHDSDVCDVNGGVGHGVGGVCDGVCGCGDCDGGAYCDVLC